MRLKPPDIFRRSKYWLSFQFQSKSKSLKAKLKATLCPHNSVSAIVPSTSQKTAFNLCMIFHYKTNIILISKESIKDKLLETDNGLVNRWILPKPINEDDITNINLNHTLQAVLIRRGIDLNNEFDEYITPSDLPNPEEHFDELSKATQRIIKACLKKEKIAICGDYDADGITSTVLLVELLSILGAIVKPFIPSRQDEGYGLNENMINNINNQGINLIITVDNGISAFAAIKKSFDLGIDLIITDQKIS